MADSVRRFMRVGRAVAVLVARLVLANVAAAVHPRARDLEPAALVRPARRKDPRRTRTEARTAEELMHVLAVDRGCATPATTHEACSAATELAPHAPESIAVQRALEETVVVARRPPCVRRAAVDALAMLDSRTAERALRRMEAVTARRVEWEARGEDAELLHRLTTVLAETTSLTRH